MIRDKDGRLCSKRYFHKDRCPPGENPMTDIYGRHVFPDDAEDIRAHKWFIGTRWDQIHNQRPPFLPTLSSAEDTKYFEESEPPEDWSDSSPGAGLSPDEIQSQLSDYRDRVQHIAINLVAEPHDSASLRMIDSELEHTPDLTDHEVALLKHFVRVFGRRQRKRPRDVLLRDANFKDVVMEVRKSTAFVGYTWRRMPRMAPTGYVMDGMY